MAVKTVVNFHAVATQNSEEITINVPDATTPAVLEERLFDPTTLVITTATGGAGTTLVAGVDYSFSDLNEYATSKAGVDVYQTLNIINAIYQGVDLFIDAGTLNQYGDNLLAADVNDLQTQIGILNGGSRKIGDIFASMKDSVTGAFKFRIGEAVNISQYQDLFDIVGHRFHDMQVAAGAADLGDLSTATTFYPTPVPGYVPNMLPTFTADSSAVTSNQLDINESYSTTAIRAILGTHQEKAIPVLVRVDSGAIPTGLTEWTRYWVNFIDSSPDKLEFYPTEADALAGTNIVGLTGVTGTVTIFPAYTENAFQGHTFSTSGGDLYDDGLNVSVGGTTAARFDNLGDEAAVISTDGSNGTPRTSDRTRGNEVYTNWFIQHSEVNGAGDLVLSPPPVFDTGRLANSDWTSQTFTADYSSISGLAGLSLHELDFEFLIYTTNSDSTGISLLDVVQTGGASAGFGLTAHQGVDSVIFYSASGGVKYLDSAGIIQTLVAQSYYYRIVVKPKVWTDLAIIQNVSGVNFKYPKFDISASNQTLDLSSLEFEPDGYRIKAKWTGGDGTYQLSIVIPTGYTLGGVAKTTIEADLKGDGQGVLQLVKNGTDLEIEKYIDTDGGQWPTDATYTGKSWKKYIDGTIEQTSTEEFIEDATSSSGSIFRIDPNRPQEAYPLPLKVFNSANIFNYSSDSAIHWVGIELPAPNQLLNWSQYFILDSASTSGVTFKVCKEVKGRWTTAQIEVS